MYARPEAPPAKKGRPNAPQARYRLIEPNPRLAPRAAPTSRTAKVCPVSGTGVKGRGMRTCDRAATNSAPAVTSNRSRAAGLTVGRLREARVGAKVVIGSNSLHFRVG